MASLVPYGSSDDEAEETSCAAASTAGSGGVERPRHVHTSLGVTREKPVKGDWLGHVFIEVLNSAELMRTLKHACDHIEEHAQKEIVVSVIELPHLSVSRPIVLRKHEEQALYDVVRDALANFNNHTGARRRSAFPVSFAQYVVLPSEDAPSTTLYLAAEVSMGWQELRALSSSLDQQLQTHLQQRPYFDEARFHVSIARVDVEDSKSRDTITSLVAQLNARFGEHLRHCPAILVDEVTVTFGNKRKRFPVS